MGGLNLTGFHTDERLVWGKSLRRRNRVAANASTHFDILLSHSPRWQKAAVSAVCELATCAAKVGYRKFASSVMGPLRAVTRRMHSRHLKQRECLNRLEPTVWIVILGGCCL